MLSGAVAVETGGAVAGPTVVPRRRQRQMHHEEMVEERRRERERRNDFRIGFNASMHEIAISAKQDMLMKLFDRLHDYELALADAEDSGSSARIRIYSRSVACTEKRIAFVEESIERMQTREVAFATSVGGSVAGSLEIEEVEREEV